MKQLFCNPVLIAALLLCGTLKGVSAQDSSEATSPDDRAIPTVSLIGEDEQLLSTLSMEYATTFLTVCNNDMDLAYDTWLIMMAAMDDHSKSIDYDIRGIKLYLHVFWNADGTIAHLAFFPKANSRNVPISELKAFMNSFVKNYAMDVSAEKGFSHYGSGSFPVHYRPQLSADKN